VVTTCYKYARPFPAAAATAEVPAGVFGQPWQPGFPAQPLGCPSPRRAPWAALGTGHRKLVCQPLAQAAGGLRLGQQRIKTGPWKIGGCYHPSCPRRSCHPPTRLMAKHHLKRPCSQPRAQRREQFCFPQRTESRSCSGAALRAGVCSAPWRGQF